jgi:hypothetical protein
MKQAATEEALVANVSAELARMAPDQPQSLLGRWAVAATVAGNALEFYDFLTYSTFAVYIGRAFFPTGSAFASLLLTLATFDSAAGRS